MKFRDFVERKLELIDELYDKYYGLTEFEDQLQMDADIGQELRMIWGDIREHLLEGAEK